MKIIQVLAALMLLGVPAAARSQTIEGVVVDDSTRAPITDVRVELVPVRGERATLRTDSTGGFRFDSVGGGGAILRFRHPSYAPVDSLAVEVARGERVEIELRMGHSAILLDPIVVRARADEGVGGFRDRMRVGAFGRFLGPDDIKRNGGTRTTDLVRMVPGVRVVQGAPGNNMIVMRGGVGDCLPDLYVDGSRIRQTREVGADAFLNPAVLEGVEVYSSAAMVPGVFFNNSNCGVVAFWTKPAPPGRFSWRKLLVGVGLGLVLLFSVR